MSEHRILVMHVISGLRTGGAETMLAKLLASSRNSGITHEIVSMTDAESKDATRQFKGVRLTSLKMRNGVPDPRSLVRLVRIMRERAPAVVQGWMYHGDLLGGLAAKMAGDIPVAWNVRNSEVDAEKWLLKLLAQVVNPPLSHWIPKTVVCCAERARDVHVGFGYAREKCVVIPNGFDLSRFKPDRDAAASFRAGLQIPDSAPLIGMVARLHPMKDHLGFLKAAAAVLKRAPDAVFVLCGEGLTANTPQVERWLSEAGLSTDRVRLIGKKEDVEKLYPALEVCVLSSKSGEGFPNVLGEALACGVPCVATDVGDSALIVGEHGRIVPPGDPAALAEAILQLIDMPASERLALGLAARRSIEERYSLAAITAQYEALYERIAGQHAGRRNP